MLAHGQFGYWKPKTEFSEDESNSPTGSLTESSLAAHMAGVLDSSANRGGHSICGKASQGKPKRKRPKFIRKVECKVCSDVANDHIHYGAIACYSCRAFFRRGVNANAPYYCSQNKSCSITKHTRKHCQYCRFQKCMAIGMRASWVMTEEDKREKKEKARIKRVTKDSGSQSESAMGSEMEHSRPGEHSLFGAMHFLAESHSEHHPHSNPLLAGGHEDSSSHSYSHEEIPHTYGMTARHSVSSPTPSSSTYSDYTPLSQPSPFDCSTSSGGGTRSHVSGPFGLERCASGGGESPSGDLEGYQSSTEYISPPSPLEHKPDISFFVEGTHIKDQPILPFTSEEVFLVDNIMNTEIATTRSIPVNPEVLMVMIDAAKKGTAIPYPALVEGYTICMRRIIQFVSKLDFFQSFSLPDQRSLLLHNTDMIVNIRSARLLRPGINLQAQVNHATGGPSLEPACASMDLFKCQERLEYKQIFQSPWACDPHHEAQFASLMENLFHLEMDVTTTTLMSMIVLFSTSYTDLKDSARAVQNQEFFSQLLYRYLGSMIGRKNATQLLPKYMHMISQLEEMSQIMMTKRLTL
eukprot:snap_masked-scaffold1268_size51707-processed-gene-0.2 protein:Tk07212 transcript:snap_masked-scaffold1268_size51707-processed-gene-0.2-mRNA-1 annotation:"vitamin d3 receptor b-like"